ncbi:MAG: LPS export ABC transporter ATP-binding protein [Bacteroidetes bacterium]|nr:LPS export ABC transporter ATP-binding protein [Bacteroidota bacterium]
MREADTLSMRGIRKLYGRKTAVADVSFSMKSGEIIGLLGPNGAGKTTIFYTIVGFINATSGNVFFNDIEITRMPMYKRAQLGISYLSQEPSVFRKLTVEKNIWAILETRKDLTHDEKKKELEKLIESFGIQDVRKQPAYTLSGGERRRTEIARNLAVSPRFLLLDEPFVGIDPIVVQDIKNIIKRLADEGIGVLITDHNVRETLEITDFSHIISHGEILVSGDSETLLASDLARTTYLGTDFKP